MNTDYDSEVDHVAPHVHATKRNRIHARDLFDRRKGRFRRCMPRLVR